MSFISTSVNLECLEQQVDENELSLFTQFSRRKTNITHTRVFGPAKLIELAVGELHKIKQGKSRVKKSRGKRGVGVARVGHKFVRVDEIDVRFGALEPVLGRSMRVQIGELQDEEIVLDGSHGRGHPDMPIRLSTSETKTILPSQ